MGKHTAPDDRYLDIHDATRFDPPLQFDTSTLDHPFYKEKNMTDTTMGQMGLTSSHDSENDPDQFLTKAKEIVAKYVDAYLRANPENQLVMPGYQVYIITFSKTLKNWKALLSTSLPDGRIYEVTYNGDKAEAYLDAYMKVQNATFADDLGRGLPR